VKQDGSSSPAMEETPVYVNVVTPDNISPTASQLDAVLVLGMHRGGTSSVAGGLVRLGGTPPRHLMAPAPDNARGFWESTVITSLNDNILTASGSTWKDWRRFDMGRIGPDQARGLRDRAKQALVEEFADAAVPIVKDPRMCRLMRFWRPLLQDLGWRASVVLPVRSPLEVARSLGRRDGFGVGASCLLWLRHMLDAEADTRGMRRAVVDWSRFLQDRPASLGRVAEQLDMRCDGHGFAEVEDFLSPDLRRFTASAAELHADPAVARIVCEVYEALLDLTNDANCAATLSLLDALRTRFDDAAVAFNASMSELERSARALEGQVARLKADIGRPECGQAEADRHVCDRDEALARANAVIAKYADRARRPRAVRAPRIGKRNELRTIRNSPLFDEAFYLDANPDVRAAGGDAALHFLVQGWREGRDPGPFFSTSGYLARNPDVAAASVNPLIHYLTYGGKEGRAAIG
jgi:hypothetical protein